nr:2659_t:CDS:2 [Entrophospora candida]
MSVFSYELVFCIDETFFNHEWIQENTINLYESSVEEFVLIIILEENWMKLNLECKVIRWNNKELEKMETKMIGRTSLFFNYK